MKSFFLKLKNWVLAHKKTAVLLVIILAGTAYGAVRIFSDTTEETRYVLGTVERGNIISSISGTGQVSSSNQVDVKSKSAGDILYLNAKTGQEIKSGSLIAQIDPGDANYELETAKLSYEELITVDTDELRDAEDAVDQAEIDLKDAYVDARATLASSATDMADVMADLDTLFGGYLNINGRFDISKTEEGYVDRAKQEWYDADDLLDEFSKAYRTVSNETSDKDIESMISDANKIANSVAQAAKYAKDAVIYLRDHEDNENTTADEAYTTVSGLVTTINATVSETLSSKNSLPDSKKTLANAKDDLEELKEGPSILELRAEELTLRQKQEALADYNVRAPFGGIIASVGAKKGESVTSGATIATLITKQKIAEISLNEIDAVKIEIGQKATLTFDATEDLTITGNVIEIDLVGTVNQGVVNYNVKIGFDTNETRVKPGMSVSATIIIDIKQDVIVVPNSAVKMQAGKSYIEMFDISLSPPESGLVGSISKIAPNKIPVEVGLANDLQSEIISGVKEGDEIITRKILPTTGNTATEPSIFGSPAGGNRGTRAN